jgi:coronin-7
MWPGECNGFHINSKRAAFLVSGSGGQISVVELNKPGRLSDSVIYTIINKSKVSDFAWDPFDDERFAVACDECVVKIWQLPAEGLVQSLEDPLFQLKGHLERLYCIKYHPYVKNLLASASYDRTIRLWNVESGVAVRVLTGHTDVVSVLLLFNSSDC